MTEVLTGAPYRRVVLTIVAATEDIALVREVEAECRARWYRFSHVGAAADLRTVIAATGADVLLLDLDGTLDRAARTARRLTSRHANLAVVLVGESPRSSLEGFRIVDRWRSGDRVLDQLELAHIGIPASIADADFPAGTRASVSEEQT